MAHLEVPARGGRLERIHDLRELRNPSELRALRQAVENLPVVSIEDLARLQEGPDYFCTGCGSRIRDPSKPSCEACGGTKASPSSKYRCMACGGPVAKDDVRCANCGIYQAIPAVKDSQPNGEYECAQCGSPVDVNWPNCVQCGNSKAVKR